MYSPFYSSEVETTVQAFQIIQIPPPVSTPQAVKTSPTDATTFHVTAQSLNRNGSDAELALEGVFSQVPCPTPVRKSRIALEACQKKRSEAGKGHTFGTPLPRTQYGKFRRRANGKGLVSVHLLAKQALSSRCHVVNDSREQNCDDSDGDDYQAHVDSQLRSLE